MFGRAVEISVISLLKMSSGIINVYMFSVVVFHFLCVIGRAAGATWWVGGTLC